LVSVKKFSPAKSYIMLSTIKHSHTAAIQPGIQEYTVRNILTGAMIFILCILVFITSASAQNKPSVSAAKNATLDTATFAGGCFWCIEAQFSELKGVMKVVSGFTGGNVAHPSYEQVCTGNTGHAEACNIIYDPSVISYDQLLSAFFIAHDPTQLNRQGHDVGTQYRSAIYYHNAGQKKLALYYIAKLDQAKAYDQKIVTEVSPFGVFYPAENYHQGYFNNNQDKPYCQYVIKPKLDKFREVFKNKLKS
jgi:peptide-methionine (S)-S-oxide reductase